MSLSVPPSIVPVTPNPLWNLNVSAPPKPARFSNELNVTILLTVPLSSLPTISNRSAPSVPVRVSPCAVPISVSMFVATSSNRLTAFVPSARLRVSFSVPPSSVGSVMTPLKSKLSAPAPPSSFPVTTAPFATLNWSAPPAAVMLIVADELIVNVSTASRAIRFSIPLNPNAGPAGVVA